MKSKLNFIHVSSIFLLVYILKQLFSNYRGHIFSVIHMDLLSADGSLLVSIISQIFIRFIPCLLLCIFMKENLKIVFKLNRITLKQGIYSIFIYISSLLTASFLNKTVSLLAVFLGRSYEMNRNPVADNPLSLLILVISIGIIPPIFEELFFRGFMLTGSSTNGNIFSIIFTSFAFSITHDNPYRLVDLFYFAFISSIIVYYTNSILPVMMIHMVTNISYVVISYIEQGDMVQNMAGSVVTDTVQNDLVSLVPTGILGVIGISFSLYSIYRLKKLREKHKIEFNMIELQQDERPIYKMFNVPIIIVIVLFIIKISAS